MATQKKQTKRVPRRLGVIRPVDKTMSHPATGKAMQYHVELQEKGQHVDSATFATYEECEDWLWSLYEIEATDGTV